MKTVGIITFHGSYNYGSSLQSFALQKTLENLGYAPEIINFRSAKQIEQYSPFMPWSKLMDKKRIILSFVYRPFKKELLKRAALFEKFQSENLKTGLLCHIEQELRKLKKYDIYISGSDQIWNTNAKDFAWCYLLCFAPDNSVKVSYAASIGPGYELTSSQDIFAELIKRYNRVSVREENAMNAIGKYTTPEQNCTVHLDPTLLLDAEYYDEYVSKNPIHNGAYILMYNPYFIRDVYDQARELSKLTGLKVVVPNINFKSYIFYPDFEKYIDCGPWEFLNLLKNATCVIGRSFHLIAFSIIYKKPFVAVNGMGDSRLSNILSKVRLESCATGTCSLEEAYKNSLSVDWKKVYVHLNSLRESCYTYLKNLRNL